MKINELDPNDQGPLFVDPLGNADVFSAALAASGALGDDNFEMLVISFTEDPILR